LPHFGLFDALGEIHRFDDLEALLDFATDTIVAEGEWGLALITFYLGDEAFYGLTGGAPDMKQRFREGFHETSLAERHAKRDAILAYNRPGTNVCFIPAGEGPKPGVAYTEGRPSEGSWDPDDRLMIMMRDWRDRIIGVLSLDNPTHGNRPDEAGYERLAAIDNFVNVVGKITENRFWSLRLKESEEAYRGIFNSAIDGFFIVDFMARIVEVNPAGCEMHGYECEEMIGMPVKEIVHPDFHDLVDATLEEVRTGAAVNVESVDIDRDGRSIDVEVHALRFLYRGRPHVLAVVRDITERKRMFERLVEKQKEESIVALAGGVAHDYNNILMGITGSLSLLRRSLPATGEATRHCDRIGSSAQKLSDLTNQLLAVARGVQSESIPLELGDVIQETIPLLEGLVRTSLRFEVGVEQGLWPVVADRVQITQVLMNLSLNAWEAMGRSGALRIGAENVEIEEDWECRRTGAHPAGEYVQLTVTDDGVGMDAETRQRVFDPFFSTKSTGRGLGLAAVLGIIRRHSASIEVESPEDGGTVVTIYLPRCPPELLEVEDDGRGDEPSAEIRHVLLVDDEEVVRDVTGSMLMALGFLVVAAEDGPSAIDTYRRRDRGFDLVLLDVQMPGMSGPEVATAIREMHPEALILLSSGHAEALVREQFDTDQIVDGFLQKPYTLENLDEAINAVLLPT
jgi:PAS domain S-box-containing protein